MATIVIRVEGVDITADVELADASFTTAVGSYPGEFSIRVKDPTSSYDFKATDNITVDIDGLRVFDGYILQATKAFPFPVVNVALQQTLIWTLRGPDVGILFTKRYVFDQSDPPARIPDYPAGTADVDMLNDLVANFLDLSGDGLTFDFTEVGSPNPDLAGLPYTLGDPWGRVMAVIGMLPGAVWGIRPDRTVFYEDDDTESAAFRLSDEPNNSTSYGYADLEWLADGTKLINDAPVWGAGLGGGPSMTYVRTQDAASIAAHGKWQAVGKFYTDLFRSTTVTNVSNSIIYGSPQNLHGGKDDATLVTCRIRQPGLRAGDKVYIESNVFGVSKVLPIRRITMIFPNPETVLYDLQLSYEIDQPLSYHEWVRIAIPQIRTKTGRTTRTYSDRLCVYDSFDDRTQSGWGTSSSGSRWFVEQGDPIVSVAGGFGYFTVPGASAAPPFYTQTSTMLPLPDVSSKEFEIAFATGFVPPVGAYNFGWLVTVGALPGSVVLDTGIQLQFQVYNSPGLTGWNLFAYDGMGRLDDYGAGQATYDLIGGFSGQDLSTLATGVTVRITRNESFVSVEIEGIQKFILETAHRNSQHQSVQFALTGPTSNLVGGVDVPIWIDAIRGSRYSAPRASVTLDNFDRVGSQGWGSTPANKGEWVTLPNPPDPLGDAQSDYTFAVVTGGGIMEIPINYTLWSQGIAGGRGRSSTLYPLDVWDPTNCVIDLDVYMPGHAIIGNESFIEVGTAIGGVGIECAKHTSTTIGGDLIDPYDINRTRITVNPNDADTPGFTLLNSGAGATDGVVLLDSPVHVRIQRTGNSQQTTTTITVAGLTHSFVTDWTSGNNPGSAEGFGYPFYINLFASFSFNDDSYYSPDYALDFSNWNPGFSTTVFAYFDNLQINSQSVPCTASATQITTSEWISMIPTTASGTVYDVGQPYVGGTLDVYVNGVRRRVGADYTEHPSAGTFTMLVALPGDLDVYVSFTPIAVGEA